MLKRILRPGLIDRLRTHFVRGPAGFGRPAAAAVFDQEYASGAWAHFHALPELARQAVIAAMATSLRPEPSVLDLGCGSGRLAQLFQPYAPRRYLGVDVSTEGLRQAATLGLTGCEFVCANFETWRPREQFDVIIFAESIGYAHDPGAIAREFLPHVAPGGLLVISHFRGGNWEAMWRRILRHADIVESTTITNAHGQTWDIRFLRARPAA